MSVDLWSPDQKGTRTATNDAPCTTASAASRTTWTTSISNAASPSFRCKRTAASSPPNKGSRARARTTDKIASEASAADRSTPLEVLLLGGLPIRAPISHYGPFVMNTRDEILQTIDDYQTGRLGIIPADQLAPRNFA